MIWCLVVQKQKGYCRRSGISGKGRWMPYGVQKLQAVQRHLSFAQYFNVSIGHVRLAMNKSRRAMESYYCIILPTASRWPLLTGWAYLIYSVFGRPEGDIIRVQERPRFMSAVRRSYVTPWVLLASFNLSTAWATVRNMQAHSATTKVRTVILWVVW
jgi:hypothetical protein